MLTERQLEIAARKLCQLMVWMPTDYAVAVAKKAIATHQLSREAQAIEYALAQQEQPNE